MSTLVVYHPDNLLNPTKVLGHAQDITAQLKRSGVTFVLLDEPISPIDADSDDRLRDFIGEHIPRYLPGFDCSHVDVLQYEAQPGYAIQDPATGEQEHWHAEEGGRLFIEGGGSLCIHHEDALHVLSCVRGTLVGLPAGTAHWFSQRTGSACKIVRMAPSAKGLSRTMSGDDIAARMELPEL